jgi:protein-histidine pros-kinase
MTPRRAMARAPDAEDPIAPTIHPHRVVTGFASIHDPRPVGAYGVALAVSGVALVLTWLTPPLAASTPFLLSFAAVALSSWYGGFGPGVVSVLVSAAGSLLFPQAGIVAVATSQQVALLSGFVLVATLIVVLGSARRRAEDARRAEESSRMASDQLAAERSAQYVTERTERERAQAGEQQLRAILAGAPDAMVIADTSGRIVQVNSQVEALFGYPPAELLGQPVELLVPDRYRAGHPAHRAGYFGEPRIRPMGAGLELSAHRKDGSEVPVEISLSPLRIGEQRLVIAAIRDVTERQRAAEALRESEERYRRIVELSPDATFISLDGTVVFANDAAGRLLGLASAADVVNRSAVEFLAAETRPSVEGRFAATLAGESVAGVEEDWLRADGARVPVEVVAAPLSWQGREALQVILRDITARKEMEAERVRARTELERVRDDLTSMVVHDLKNPVNGIAMTTRLALRKAADLPESHRRYLVQIDRSTREMMRLIQNLLEISKIEEGKMPLVREPIVLAAVVDEVAAEYLPLAEEAGKRLIVSVDTTLPPATADHALLRRVLVNLIANALRHSGSAEVRIEASAEPAGVVTLRVVDHGRGIPAEDQARIFEKFGSVRRSPTAEPVTDTGLGLPFCKLAIERMGGTIELTSRAGGPTVFAVTLPA